jgi:hypothetical protein
VDATQPGCFFANVSGAADAKIVSFSVEIRNSVLKIYAAAPDAGQYFVIDSPSH